MPDLKFTNSNKSVAIVTSEEQQAAIPDWFAEVVLIAHLWVESGLVSALKEQVKVSRGRMGWYEVLDFTLQLLAYGVSQEFRLSDYFKQLFPFRTALSALWERDKCSCPRI